jgi:integrase
MAIKKLTDKAILAARAEDGQRLELWDDQTAGLCLRVSAKDGKQRKVWVWRYRTKDGRQPRLTMAEYSDQFGLRWARDRVERLRVEVRDGADPAGDARKAKAAALAEPIRTFEDLCDKFLEASEKGRWKPRKKQKRASTIARERAVIDRYLKPRLGKLRVEDIDRRVLRRLFSDMADQGIGAQANKAHAVARQVLAYAVAHDRISSNPAGVVERPAEIKRRMRTLTDAEVKALWGLLVNLPEGTRLPPKEGQDKGRPLYVGRPVRITLQLALLLLNRRGEIAGMRCEELNLDQGTWLIPAERMKGGQPHLVTLPPRSVKLIREALELAAEDREEAPPVVFPSPRDPAKSVKPDSLTHAMADLCAVLGIADASPHDLRRTGASALTSERLKVSPLIRSRVLAHSSDAGGGAAVSAAHYDANTYITEKRAALAAWEGLVLEIVGEKPRPSNVRPMRAAQ